MTQVGADRPSPGNRICQPPACFAADPELLRLAWRNADSFDRYLQRAGPQDAPASSAPAAEPRSARPEQAPEREDRDTTDRAPAAAENRVHNRPDGEEADTAAASETERESESPNETAPSDETGKAREDDQGKESESTSSTEQPAAAVVTASLEQRVSDNEGKAERTAGDGEETSEQTQDGKAKLESELAKRGAAAAPKSVARANTARQLDAAAETPAESAEGEQEPDEAPQPEGKGKAKSLREPVLSRADTSRQTDGTAKRSDEPSGRQAASPGEPSSEPDEPSGRSERAAEGGEPNPRRVATAALEPLAQTSAGNTSARRDVAPADAAAGAAASLTDENDSTRTNEPHAQGAKPLRGLEAEPKADAPLRVTTEARSGPSSVRPAGSAPEAGQVDRARFVQRVARAFEAMGGRQGVVRLRLHPPELGSLRLEIQVRGGMMHARVEAENAAVRNLLLDQLPQLRDRLAQQDIKIQQFDVALSDRSAGETSQQPTHHAPGDGERSGRDASSSRTEGRAAPEDAPSAIEVPTWPGEGGRLNVLI